MWGSWKVSKREDESAEYVWEREKEHEGVRGSGVCSSSSGLSV